MVQFIELLHNHSPFKILETLSFSPGPLHVKEISRRSKVSQGSASETLATLDSCGLLNVEKEGNMKKCSLKDGFLSRQLKVLFFLSKLDSLSLIERFLDKDPGISAIFLYGSFADGSYDKKSDVDFLLISDSSIDFSDLLSELEIGLGREISLLSWKSSELMTAPKKNAVFYNELARKHVVLYGTELP